jgi:hypothetical protein
MAESHFLSALKQRRSEDLGQLQSIQMKMSELEASEAEVLRVLADVDGLLHVEAPDLALESIQPRKRRESHPRTGGIGESGGRAPLSQAILKTLRTRWTPTSAREVFEAVRNAYEYGNKTKWLRNVSTFLSVKKKVGLLRAVANDGEGVKYLVAA